MCENKNIFDKLITEIGLWAADNFGDNVSKWPGHDPNQGDVETIITLDHTACLLGIAEELGELSEAMKDASKDLIRDSIGDTLIYLADYIYRIGLDASIIDWDRATHDLWNTVFLPREMLILTGRLAHINLKRHQGIRGYDGDRFFKELQTYLTHLMIQLRCVYVQAFPRDAGDDLLALRRLSPREGLDAIIAVMGSTWKHVQERNWKKNPASGK